MYAVVNTGGKQYKVRQGEILRVEKLPGDVGSPVTFDRVLMFADGEDVSIGQPVLDNVAVEGHIVEQGKAKKIIVFKYKRRKRYRRKQGHRQEFTAVQIDSITDKGAKAGKAAEISDEPKPKAKKAEAEPKAEAKKETAKKESVKKSETKEAETKKEAAKKAAPKKAAAKKVEDKKTTPKKEAAKKAEAKADAPKKADAKETSTEKPKAKKPATKKTVTKEDTDK